MRMWRLFKQFVKRLINRNPVLARIYYHYTLRRESREYEKPPLLIYQMGKVGSKTIQRSLRTIKLDRPVFHVHFLTPDRVKRTEKERRKYLGTDRMGLLRHVWQYQYLLKRLGSRSNGKKWKIITLTREPIGRNIATFFENLSVEALDDGHRYRIQSDYYGFEGTFTLENIDQLKHLFFERLYHDRPLVFFDEELKGMFGIDVFACEFPTSKGYKIYEGERADVLLIRLESLNDCATDAFREFLGIEDFTLVNANVASAKVYAPLYRKFKKTAVLPEDYVERMYTSKYTQHFYSQEEIARFRARWHTREEGPPSIPPASRGEGPPSVPPASRGEGAT